ncbi:cation-translocating P-type ATPase [Metamycoplasma equirhinis]|uniref:cation-translocating P-type ATPase n=1 Tax=Metamycoplasma equirhinis TaxID=92402 RepID=UPI003593AEBB
MAKLQKKSHNQIQYQINEIEIKTDIKTGLNENEIKARQEKYGKNKLDETKKLNPFIAYLSQFKDILVIILLFASLLSYILAIVNGVESNWNWYGNNNRLLIEFIEPTIILFVVLTNSAIGAIQEIKSAKAIDALKKLSPLQSRVIRNGNLMLIEATDITIGDIVMVESGDVIPADGYLLTSSNLSVIESSLTGESEPAFKDANMARNLQLPIADRRFMVYSSSIVATGTGYFVVTAIAKNTELGKISNLVSSQKSTISPLQIKINKLGKIFGYAGLALFCLSFIVQIIFQLATKSSLTDKIFWSTSIVNAISLAVAAIPEGLIAFSSIILAIGIQRMAKQKAIVKDLMAVEALGSCAVICSDKTGTLTQNKMTIIDIFDGKNFSSKKQITNENLIKVIEYGSLCSEANLINDNGIYKVAGDPTEISFLYELEKHSINKYKNNLISQHPRLFTIPFDSSRKLMTSIHLINNENILITKGAPDVLLHKCANINQIEKQKILEQNEKWANQAYRVLAIGYRKVDNLFLNKVSQKNIEEIESDFEFLGLIAMIDPPRETARESILQCKRAGIKPIMITGDNLNTAIAIAKNLGIFTSGDKAITGTDLDKISDDELTKTIEQYSVYARVKPEDKLRIVNAWQKNEQVVAMTGDGVNDAPALKASDIGCAMGITGTEASKQAANIILADDNFATIVKAVDNGRSIYQKIKNVIQNLLITSIAEIILVFIGLLVFRAIFSSISWKSQLGNQEIYILSASQLLWINLFTHGFPAIALGLQDSKENFMNHRPIYKYESIFSGGMGIDTLCKGLLIGVLSMMGYYLGALWAYYNSPNNIISAASTMAFLILGITAAFNSINLMSSKPIILLNPIYYWKVYLSVIFSISFLIIVAFANKLALVFKGYVNLKSAPALIGIGLGLPMFLIPIYLIQKVTNLLVSKFEKFDSNNSGFVMIKSNNKSKHIQ